MTDLEKLKKTFTEIGVEFEEKIGEKATYLSTEDKGYYHNLVTDNLFEVTVRTDFYFQHGKFISRGVSLD